MQPRWSFRHPAGAHISYSDEFENALPSCSISAIQSQLFDLSCSIWERDFGRLKHFCCVHIFGIFRFQSFRFAYKLFCFASKQNKLNKTFFSLFCFAHFRFRLASFRFEMRRHPIPTQDEGVGLSVLWYLFFVCITPRSQSPTLIVTRVSVSIRTS